MSISMTSIPKTCLFALTLASQCLIHQVNSTACPPTVFPTGTAVSVNMTPGVVVSMSSHQVEPLPPGAKIISTRVLTAEEVAARKACPAAQATAISAPAKAQAEPKTEAKPKVAIEPETAQPDELVTEIHDVVDLQTDEEIEVDVRFAEEAVGSAILIAGEFETELEITEWKPDAICLRMPGLGILKPMNVRVALYRPDGHLVRQFDARLIRRQGIRRIERQRLVSTEIATETFPADLPE